MLLVFTGALVLAGRLAIDGWTAWQSLRVVRTQFGAAQQAVSRGDTTALQASLRRLSSQAARADAATSGPSWSLAAALPVAGHSLRTVHGIAAAAQQLSHDVVPPLITVSDDLQPAELTRPDGGLAVARLAAAQAPLDAALRGLDVVRRNIARLPTSAVPGPINRARASLAGTLDTTASRLSTLSTAARIGPPMLGASGPRTYFVAFQNPAEARGTGGLLGIYGILSVRNGSAKLLSVGSDTSLRPAGSPVVALPADYLQQYGQFSPAQYWTSSNLSPDFPQAARIWAGLWKAQGGQPVDGAVSVDPVTMSYLLGVTGPVTLPDGTRVTAANVVDLTTSSAYVRFPDSTARKDFLADLTRSVFEAVTSRGMHHPQALLSALARAVGDGRLHVASTAHPDEQQRLLSLPIGGELPRTSAPFALVRVLNAGANKLDYYLDRRITYTGGTCVAGSRSTAVSIRLTNRAHGQLPAYVSGLVNASTGVPTDGTNRMDLSLFSTSGARLRDVRIDGRAMSATVNEERGHPVFGVRLDVPPGGTRTVTFDLDEPAVAGDPLVPVQPLIRPATVETSFASCRGLS